MLHPSVVAFNSLLSVHGVVVDVYIRQAATPGFNVSTGIKTSTKTKYPRIQAVECPIDSKLLRAFSSTPMQKQRLTTSIVIRTISVPEPVKLNDYVFFRNQRYEVVESTTVAGQLYMLGLSHWNGDKREITWDVCIKDGMSFTDAVTRT